MCCPAAGCCRTAAADRTRTTRANTRLKCKCSRTVRWWDRPSRRPDYGTCPGSSGRNQSRWRSLRPSRRRRAPANDRLVFVGVVESVVDLQKIRGLLPATNQVIKLGGPRASGALIEAVVSHLSFDRTNHSRRSISQHLQRRGGRRGRNGERINKKIGDIVLQPGDTLLVEAFPRSSNSSVTRGTSTWSAKSRTPTRCAMTGPWRPW